MCNLEATMGKSLTLKNQVETYQFSEARKTAKELYRDGISMIIAELSQPIIKDEESVLPIAVSLEAIISEPSAQDFVGLMRTISKLYRVFVELRAYQPWRIKGTHPTESMPVDTVMRDRFIDTTIKLKTILKNRRGATGAIFELRCARQAARQLTPADPHWQKYCLHIADILTAVPTAPGGDLSAVWEAFKRLTGDLQRNCPIAKYTWYQQVQVMRWESTRVRTSKDFEDKVGNNIQMCKEKGGNLSLCLAKVLMQLIKHPNPEVKSRAFRGTIIGETMIHEGLIHMILWNPMDAPRGLIKRAVDKTRFTVDRVIRMEDPFWETRDLVANYLKRLASKDKYVEFRDESLAALRDRLDQLNARGKKKGHSLDEEKIRLDERLEQVQKDITKCVRKIAGNGGEQVMLVTEITQDKSGEGELTKSISDYQQEKIKLELQGNYYIHLKKQCVSTLKKLEARNPASPSEFDYVSLTEGLTLQESSLIEDILKGLSPSDTSRSTSPADTSRPPSQADTSRSTSPADTSRSPSQADTSRSSSPADTRSPSPAETIQTSQALPFSMKVLRAHQRIKKPL
ncbi:MAG: hypothetical protein ACHQUC_01475 [Chlamydiales bacterium]